MPKPVKQSEEEKRRKEEEESEDSDSSEEESSDSSDSSDDSSSDSSNSSNDSSDDSSDSSDSDDSSDESEEEAKPKKEEKGKKKVVEEVTKGTKNKRSDEESSSKGSQPDQKKAKKEEPKTNGHANGTTNVTKETEKWRQENQITVVNLGDSAVNPTAPFFQFADATFPDFVLKSMKDFNFAKPTPIQAQSWPLAAQKRDIIGIAETGSGKTLAFGYPAIVNIKALKKPVVGPKVLVLAPTRELAQQIHDVMIKACVPANLNTCVVFGGVSKVGQSAEIKKADIVVATPGRLIDLIQDGTAKLQNVKYLVFDEADRMLDMGFIPQIRAIVEQLPKGADRQTLMFSATWPVDVQKFAHTYLQDPVQITIGKGGEKLAGAKRVTQIVEVCQKEHERRPRIKKLLKMLCDKETRPRILIFMLYKNSCDALYTELLREKWNVECLHGGKNQAVRDKAVQNFKSGATHILVATDVAARGLDIKDIKYVINGELPLVMEDYIHRIGRTGRAGESGSAYTVFSPDDKVHARQLVRILEEGNHTVPAELAKIAENAPVTKPRKSTMEILYGDFAKGVDPEQMMKKATKITFD